MHNGHRARVAIMRYCLDEDVQKYMEDQETHHKFVPITFFTGLFLLMLLNVSLVKMNVGDFCGFKNSFGSRWSKKASFL